MKPLLCILLILMVAPSPAWCQPDSLFTSDGYLGLPDNERYPQSAHQPSQVIPKQRYFSISAITTTDAKHFKETEASGGARYITQKDGFVYYATEVRGDFVHLLAGTRAWVTILLRYKCKAP